MSKVIDPKIKQSIVEHFARYWPKWSIDRIANLHDVSANCVRQAVIRRVHELGRELPYLKEHSNQLDYEAIVNIIK